MGRQKATDPMPNPVLGTFHAPGSLRQLTRGRGWNSELTGFLLPLARRDYWFKHYDFEEQTINPDWTVANSSGTGAANFAITANVEDGYLQGDTGTDDNGSVVIRYDTAMFDAARNPGIEARFEFDTVTDNPYFELGMHDPATNEYTINVSDIDTPTLASNGVTDAFFVAMDPPETLKSPALLTVGTTDSVAKTVIGASPGANPFTAAEYSTLLVQGFETAAYAILDDNLGTAAKISTGPDTGVLMLPYFLVATRDSGTAVFPRVDYITLWKERGPA